MRYPCNLFGQPASPWVFWSRAMPARFRQLPCKPGPSAAPGRHAREWTDIDRKGVISRQAATRS
jgi:hypothetical protein